MTTSKSRLQTGPELPARLEAVRRRFDEWRRTRPTRVCPIPAQLWTAAAGCATRYGAYRTAQALGLDSGKLNRKVSPQRKKEPKKRAAPFVELVPGGPAAVAEYVLELENRSGSRLRIQLRGGDRVDLAELARSFTGEGA